MAPPRESVMFTELRDSLRSLQPGAGRTALQQAGYQLAALASTMVISIVAGTVTGTFKLQQGDVS